jgi:hypothetical protein
MTPKLTPISATYSSIDLCVLSIKSFFHNSPPVISCELWQDLPFRLAELFSCATYSVSLFSVDGRKRKWGPCPTLHSNHNRQDSVMAHTNSRDTHEYSQ